MDFGEQYDQASHQLKLKMSVMGLLSNLYGPITALQNADAVCAFLESLPSVEKQAQEESNARLKAAPETEAAE